MWCLLVSLGNLIALSILYENIHKQNVHWLSRRILLNRVRVISKSSNLIDFNRNEIDLYQKSQIVLTFLIKFDVFDLLIHNFDLLIDNFLSNFDYMVENISKMINFN